MQLKDGLREEESRDIAARIETQVTNAVAAYEGGGEGAPGGNKGKRRRYDKNNKPCSSTRLILVLGFRLCGKR